MKTEKITYLKGEDSESVELFEPLWLTVLDRFKSENKVALMLPCTWGKPYWQSYIAHTILSTLLACFEKIKTIDPLLAGTEDILDLIDVWHMSSCGFVPAEMQDYRQTIDGYGMTLSFSAYDWDSSRASDEDTKAWYVAAERRLYQWYKNIAPSYDTTVVYLRKGSKSEQIWLPYLDKVGKFDIRYAYLENVNDYPDLDKKMTLNGRLKDPDLVLLNPERITYLTMCLYTAIARSRKIE